MRLLLKPLALPDMLICERGSHNSCAFGVHTALLRVVAGRPGAALWLTTGAGSFFCDGACTSAGRKPREAAEQLRNRSRAATRERILADASLRSARVQAVRQKC
ncbi:unnamed protein product [Prorocentrum cordatum]|uniref:Uncharacterized protein n=1 Tax=Prorocentrum cordatum TaxID=2364126 RepID=A0ABN9R2K4_9DINO|nr:unnamed protein product [Polarella glacialis]